MSQIKVLADIVSGETIFLACRHSHFLCVLTWQRERERERRREGGRGRERREGEIVSTGSGVSYFSYKGTSPVGLSRVALGGQSINIWILEGTQFSP